MFEGPWDNESKFRNELEQLINKYSGENASDTPDFILAAYLTECLLTYNRIQIAREKWYDRFPPKFIPELPGDTK